MINQKLEALAERWMSEAHTLRERYDDSSRAKLFEAVAKDLRAVISDHDDQLLTLQSAAVESGYSANHLGRLVRNDKLANYGKTNAPKVRRADLPTKARGQKRRLQECSTAFTLGSTRTQIAREAIEPFVGVTANG